MQLRPSGQLARPGPPASPQGRQGTSEAGACSGCGPAEPGQSTASSGASSLPLLLGKIAPFPATHPPAPPPCQTPQHTETVGLTPPRNHLQQRKQAQRGVAQTARAGGAPPGGRAPERARRRHGGLSLRRQVEPGPRRLSKSDRVEDSNSTQTLPRFELQMSHWRRPAGPGAPGRGRCPQDSRPVSGSDSRGCPDGGLHGCHFTCLHSGDCHSPEPHPPGRCLGGRVTHQAGKERSQD